MEVKHPWVHRTQLSRTKFRVWATLKRRCRRPPTKEVWRQAPHGDTGIRGKLSLKLPQSGITVPRGAGGEGAQELQRGEGWEMPSVCTGEPEVPPRGHPGTLEPMPIRDP